MKAYITHIDFFIFHHALFTKQKLEFVQKNKAHLNKLFVQRMNLKKTLLKVNNTNYEKLINIYSDQSFNFLVPYYQNGKD